MKNRIIFFIRTCHFSIENLWFTTCELYRIEKTQFLLEFNRWSSQPVSAYQLNANLAIKKYFEF